MSIYNSKILSLVELENELEVSYLESGDVILEREQYNSGGEHSYTDRIILTKKDLESILETHKQIHG